MELHLMITLFIQLILGVSIHTSETDVVKLPPQYASLGGVATFRCLTGNGLSHWLLTDTNGTQQIVAVEQPAIGHPWQTTVSKISSVNRLYQLEILEVKQYMFGGRYCCSSKDRMACSTLIEAPVEISAVATDGTCYQSPDLAGPSPQCVVPDTAARFTCTVGMDTSHWTYQKPGDLSHTLLTQDDVVLIERNTYDVHYIQINETHRHTVLVVKEVKEDLIGMQYSCVYNGTSSCATIKQAVLNMQQIDSSITVEELGNSIRGHISNYRAVPGITLLLYINSQLVQKIEPAGCDVQTELEMPYSYEFENHELADCINIELNFSHPLSKEETLDQMFHIVRGSDDLCVNREELQGPEDQCLVLGETASFTCVTPHGSVQWQYQRPGYDDPSRLASNGRLIQAERGQYTVDTKTINTTHNEVSLVLHHVTEELISTRFYCVHDGISSCATLRAAKFDNAHIKGNIRVNESRGLIIGHVSGFDAVPGIHLYLYINSRQVSEEKPVGCVYSNQTNLEHKYKFYKHWRGDYMNITLKYTHPKINDEQTLETIWYIVTRHGSRSFQSCPKRQNLDGPADTCATIGDDVSYTCSVGSQDVHWFYQEAESETYTMIARNRQIVAYQTHYTLMLGDVSENGTKNVSITVHNVTEDMNLTRYFCGNQDVSSCAVLKLAELLNDNITANITLTDGNILIHVTEFLALPAIHLYLYANSEPILEHDAGCVAQREVFIVHSHTFYTAGDINLYLTYSHPTSSEEVYLSHTNLTIEYELMASSVEYAIPVSAGISGLIALVMIVLTVVFVLVRCKRKELHEPPQKMNKHTQQYNGTAYKAVHNGIHQNGNGNIRKGTKKRITKEDIGEVVPNSFVVLTDRSQTQRSPCMPRS